MYVPTGCLHRRSPGGRLRGQVLTVSRTWVVACCRLLMRENRSLTPPSPLPFFNVGFCPLWGFCSLTAQPCLGLESFLKPQCPRSSDSLGFYLPWSLRRARRWVPVSSEQPMKKDSSPTCDYQEIREACEVVAMQKQGARLGSLYCG